MFCPNRECPDFIDESVHGEYVDTFIVCPKCGATLVPEPPAEFSATCPLEVTEDEFPAEAVAAIGPLVAVAAFDYPDEAQSTVELLSSHGIVVFEFIDDGRDFADKGGVATCTRLLVSQDDSHRAEHLVKRGN